MRNRSKTVPRFIRRGEAEPHAGAFRAWVASIMDDSHCCAHGASDLCALLAALDAPVGACVLCGEAGTWRKGYNLPEEAYRPAGCTRVHTPQVYGDLCEGCNRLPDAHARALATLRLRPQAPWN